MGTADENTHATGPTATRVYPRHTRTPLALAALLVFASGALVYMADRHGHTAWLLPDALRLPAGHRAVFGSVGAWLPSLAHAFAFSTWTALLPGWRRPATACLLWAGIDAGFELAQYPALASRLLAWRPDWLTQVPIFEHIEFLLHGTFDPLDLLAVVIGAFLSLLLLLRASHTPILLGEFS
jgi:hypothetical protein